MPEACPPTCLPGARERAAERGANAGEQGLGCAPSGAGWIRIENDDYRPPCERAAPPWRRRHWRGRDGQDHLSPFESEVFVPLH